MSCIMSFQFQTHVTDLMLQYEKLWKLFFLHAISVNGDWSFQAKKRMQKHQTHHKNDPYDFWSHTIDLCDEQMEVFNHVIKCPAMRSDQGLSDVTFLMNNNWNFTQNYHVASEDLE